MKKLAILLLLISISCNNQKKDESLNVEKKISKEKVVHNISVLRKCGFFEEFDNLRDKDVF